MISPRFFSSPLLLPSPLYPSRSFLHHAPTSKASQKEKVTSFFSLVLLLLMFSEVLLPSFPAFLTPLKQQTRREISSLSLAALHLKKEIISRNGGGGRGGRFGCGWVGVRVCVAGGIESSVFAVISPPIKSTCSR